MTYETWYALTNEQVIKRCSLSIDCLPDSPTRDYWEDGIEPEEAAELIIEWAKTFL